MFLVGIGNKFCDCVVVLELIEPAIRKQFLNVIEDGPISETL